MEAIPIAIFWLTAIWTVFQKKHFLIYLFFISLPFGSFAAIPTTLLGGLTLTPAPVVALILIIREFSSPGGLRQACASALKLRGLLLLFLFWVVSGICTAFMPRFFAGKIEVIPMRNEGVVSVAMLVPTTQNFSQFVYVTISVFSVFAFSRILRSVDAQRHALLALCVGATATAFTGLIDYASQALALQSVLEIFRTASYALLTDDSVLDSRRVVGLMPEASSFGGLVLSFLVGIYFFRRAMTIGSTQVVAIRVLLFALTALLWLSTSSSAYLGAALFMLAIVSEWFGRFFFIKYNPYLRRSLAIEFWVGVLIVITFILIALALPQKLAPMLRILDVTVLQKSNSSSYEERSMWTAVSWDALVATYGFGVGVGSTRASNFAVAIASNTGLIGSGLYFLFLIQLFLFRHVSKKNYEARALLAACRWSLLPTFFAMLTVGTTPDFGLFNAFLYGFAVAVTHRNRRVRENFCEPKKIRNRFTEIALNTKSSAESSSANQT